MALELDDRPVHYLVCGHTAPAPDPDPGNGDAELLPRTVLCPVCGVERIVDGYDATAAV
jgi:hypothetical protein